MCFISAKADDTFYLGEHVPDIYIYMNRINKKVYRQFRMIYKSDTNELVYCIEPGTTLASGTYDKNEEYNDVFNLSVEKWNKIKLIAYYGYNYENHTDLKWYAITQYMIWKEIMPDNWEMYFVDKSHHKKEDLYQDEINEIYNLVNNHTSNLGISNTNNYNYLDDVVIEGNDLLNRYETNKGYIENGKLYINNSLKIGDNNIVLSYKNYKSPLFYYSSRGQNILLSGDIYNKNFNFNIHIMAGRIKINECNEKEFKKDFLGGTYEILDQDNEVVETITCQDENCISSYLPVGSYNIRVKNIDENYEVNNHTYDVFINDYDTKDIDVCSMPKTKETKKIIIEEPSDEIKPNEEKNNIIDEQIVDIPKDDDNSEIIDIPYTSKNSFLRLFIFITTILSIIVYKKYETSF